MELVTAEQLLDELHIDASESEIDTMKRLIIDSSALIRESITNEVTDQELLALSGDVYNRLVSSLATKMYYDRDLVNGYGVGIRSMLVQMRSRYLGGHLDGNV